jgi:hypothetical protein
MILTTECALIDIKEENAGGGSMGGGARNDVNQRKLLKKSVSFNNETGFRLPYTNTAL